MNLKVEKDRIYHQWSLWEDYPCGFYNNSSGKEKEEKLQKALDMFNNENLTIDNMLAVVNNWRYSCEHNLTNNSMNKIAYIGQAACAYYAEVPSTVTMEAWNLLSKEVQERSNRIAEEVLNIWKNNRDAKV